MVATAIPLGLSSQNSRALQAVLTNGGSASHSYLTDDALIGGRSATRNLADAIHHLTLLHGRQPGVIDHAALHTAEPAAREWIISATAEFARERSYLTKLAVAIGPLPSTPGQAETEAAVLGQHHALDMLAQSDRIGCAFGAAAALVIDWRDIRGLLNIAADRLGVDIPLSKLPHPDETMTVARALSTTPAIERAISFGAQQLLLQHRGLWDLLKARHIARASV